MSWTNRKTKGFLKLSQLFRLQVYFYLKHQPGIGCKERLGGSYEYYIFHFCCSVFKHETVLEWPTYACVCLKQLSHLICVVQLGTCANESCLCPECFVEALRKALNCEQ
jgi:hypothetical protein